MYRESATVFDKKPKIPSKPPLQYRLLPLPSSPSLFVLLVVDIVVFVATITVSQYQQLLPPQPFLSPLSFIDSVGNVSVSIYRCYLEMYQICFSEKITLTSDILCYHFASTRDLDGTYDHVEFLNHAK